MSPVPLSELQGRSFDSRSKVPTSVPSDFKLSIPENLVVTGKEGYFLCQWTAPVAGADGYHVAVSTTQDIATPDIGIFTVVGSKSAMWHYLIGNVALTRYFAVRAFQGVPLRYVSEFTEVKSATSRLMTDAGSAEPSSPSSPPSSSEPPPSGGDQGVGDPGPELQ